MAGLDRSPPEGAPSPVEFLPVDDEFGCVEEELVTPAPRLGRRTRRVTAGLAVLAVLGAGGWRIAATDQPAHHPAHHPAHLAATRTALAPTQYLPVVPTSPAGRARAVCLDNVDAGMAVLTRTYVGAKRDGLSEQQSRRIAEATLADSIPGGSSQPWFGSVVSIWLAGLSPRFDGTRPVDVYCSS